MNLITKKCSTFDSFILIIISLVLACYVPKLQCNNSEQTTRELVMAAEHVRTMEIYGACDVPKPQIIYPSSHHPSKMLNPRGTILFRCNDIAGCCNHSTESCQPLESQLIQVVFYSHSVRNHARHSRKKRTNKLTETFYLQNHTKCGCLPIENLVN